MPAGDHFVLRRQLQVLSPAQLHPGGVIARLKAEAGPQQSLSLSLSLSLLLDATRHGQGKALDTWKIQGRSPGKQQD
jgi:hypothetical protein